MKRPVNLIELKIKRAMIWLIFTTIFALVGIIAGFIESIFGNGFWMTMLLFSMPCIINILYILILWFVKLRQS